MLQITGLLFNKCLELPAVHTFPGSGHHLSTISKELPIDRTYHEASQNERFRKEDLQDRTGLHLHLLYV